jgi:hygromycin-B 7''-O-kinase
MRPADSPTADPVLSPGEVLAIVRRHVPGARALTGIDESGRKGRAYFVDEGIVLKTHRPARLRGRLVEEFETSLEKEAFFLAQMEGVEGILTPRPLGHGCEAGVDYVCMTRVSGTSLRRLDLEPGRRGRALRTLGSVLARIHKLPVQPFRATELFPGDETPAALRQRMTSLLIEIADAANGLPREARISGDARDVAVRALALLPEHCTPVSLHSNPAGEHVFVDPERGELLGLIDFGDAYLSHAAFDLRPWRRPEEREAVLAGYAQVSPVDDDFMGAMKVAMVLGELANVTRQRQPPAASQAIIEEILAW